MHILLFSYNIKYSNLTLSNAITPVIAEGKAQNVIKELKEKYGYYVNPCGGENSNNIFRVSHVGNINENDLIDLAEKINEALALYLNKIIRRSLLWQNLLK